MNAQPQTAAHPEVFILVVDDIPKNIQVVGSILTEAGYEIMPATSGLQALDRVQARVPDLILLDLMMPEMDGTEVCRRLKAQDSTREVPVIFLTASNETNHLVSAFESGAIDYVTKPFNSSELLARVRTHLELKFSREALVAANARLSELNREKNELMGIVAHDLRNPLGEAMGCAQLVLMTPEMQREEIDGLCRDMVKASENMLDLIRNLLDFNRVERGQIGNDRQECDMAEFIGQIVSPHRARAGKKQQELRVSGPADLRGAIETQSFRQVLDNLLSNAVKYTPIGGGVDLRWTAGDGNLRIEVEDDGPGFTKADQARLFCSFTRLSAKPTGGEGSVGLGLSIVKKLVDGLGGKIRHESRGRGACFILEIPWPRPGVERGRKV